MIDADYLLCKLGCHSSGKNDILKFSSSHTMRLDSQFFVCKFELKNVKTRKLHFLSLAATASGCCFEQEREKKKHINQKLFNGICWLNVCWF